MAGIILAQSVLMQGFPLRDSEVRGQHIQLLSKCL